jgi:DNA-binding GntR family transcriptional regulator
MNNDTSDSAYQTLRDAIVRGTIAPGTQIPEVALAEELGVSRTPLREAVNRLEGNGLVERAPNRRLYVTLVSADEARQLYSVRMALEDLALADAATRMTDEVLDELGQRLERMQKAERSRRENVAEGGRSFHEILYRAAGNSVNEEILQRLQVKIDRYRYIGTRDGHRRQRQAVDEHRAIYEALRKRDVMGARHAMREHLGRACGEALAVLASPLDGQAPKPAARRRRAPKKAAAKVS